LWRRAITLSQGDMNHIAQTGPALQKKGCQSIFSAYIRNKCALTPLFWMA
jgi:hypothetical protein